MDIADEDSPDLRGRALRRWAGRAGLALAAIAVLAAGYLWITRERIASDLIDGYLAESGLAARYEVASIGPRRQVIENVVIGDPAAPDLTIGRLSVDIGLGWSGPSIKALEIEQPRLRGSYRDGALSFGALDRVLFAGEERQAGLPALGVKLIDGGLVIATDYGAMAAQIEGEGRLDDGFAGTLALTAPGIGQQGCTARRATAYGTLTTARGVPRFAGPVRLRDAGCGEVRLASADIAAVLTADSDLTALEGQFELVTGPVIAGANAIAAIRGSAKASLSADRLVLDHDLSAGRVDLTYASIAMLRADGTLRSMEGLAQTSWEARIEGGGIDLGQGSAAAWANARKASEGTLLSSLLAKLERNLGAATRGATFAGDVTWRLDDKAQGLVIPEGRLRSASGETLLAVSRLSWRGASGAGPARLSGNFLTGGQGLPRITGRIEQAGRAGALALRMTMAEYSAGSDRIALPRLTVLQEAGGAYRFAGSLTASGALPGGSIRGLAVPLAGRFDRRSGLALGMQCETVRFAEARIYDLSLRGRALRLCPERTGAAMVRYDDTLRLAMVSEDVEIEGDFAGTPSHFAAARAALAYSGRGAGEAPGAFVLGDLEARIGSEGNALRLAAAALEGVFDPASRGSPLGGGFSGAAARLDPVPLDLSDLSGQWSYADGALEVSQARFGLTERTQGDALARFEPLVAREATLTLKGNEIDARALLQHQASGTAITEVGITHDLASASGSARIDVPGLTFGTGLELHDLTYLAKGVVANMRGTVRGEGRIDWNGEEVTSSGVFRSDSLDLAAAFGPVRGLRGEVRFSDLLSMTTEPAQVVRIASINPGVEALDGVVRFALTDGQIIAIEDARWPFMGGELVMQPTVLRYGEDSEQRYVFSVTGLDAAKFIAQMELTNLAATGTFDGRVPVVFDADGNGRIERSVLAARPPGGNLSYIGELTYEDLGTMGNYAFRSLRSLDYRDMRVELDGDLAGEIITRFRIDGVRQGAAASQNFVTRRLARLPIRFNVNVRSENFYELATMVRTFWDPDALPDAIDQGVIPRPRPREPQPDDPEGGAGEATRPDEPTVQPPESDSVP